MTAIRHSYSEAQLAALMGVSVRTVQRWKRKHGLGRKVWLSDLRRLFPEAYQSARLMASFQPEETPDAASE